MLPLPKDLFVQQGSDYEYTFELRTKDNSLFDLTEYEVVSEIKRYYNTNKIYDSISTIVSAQDGVVKFKISSETTSGMDAERYVYCIKAMKSGIILTLAFGHILMERF